MNLTASTPSSKPATPERKPIDLVYLIFGAAWICLVCWLLQTGGWLVEQIFIATGLTWPGWGWPAILAGQSSLLLLPLLILSRRRQSPTAGIFRAWLIAAIFPLLLIPLRLTAVPDAFWTTILQIGSSLLYLALVWLSGRRGQLDRRSLPRPSRTWLLVGLVGPVLSYPWLAWGALGSPLDTLLSLVAGCLFGLAAALLLDQSLTAGDWANFSSSGLAAGATLLILASGLSTSGMQLLLMGSLSALGWAVAALYLVEDGRPWLPAAAIIGLLAATPLALVDADELLLLLNLETRDVLAWSIRAAAVTIPVGWLAGLLLYRLRRPRPAQMMRSLLRGGIVITWLGGALIYGLTGQPGFYGDRLFVILTDQADLSAAASIADIAERRRFVYTTLVQHAAATQADLRARLDRVGLAYRPYYLVNALEVEAGPAFRPWLAAQPGVDRVLDNPTLRPLPALPLPAVGQAEPPDQPQWNLTMIGADRVWSELGVTGQGVVIGQSDSGVDWQHPELRPSYRGGDQAHDYNWFDPWYGTSEPNDIGGHGTHTLGSIVGRTTGVAPGATWYGCANLTRNLGNPALYLDCMQFMLAPFPLGGDPFVSGDPARSADVLNNSWGCPAFEGCDPTALLAAIRALRAAGIFVVVSAGNEGPACASVADPPALYAEAFSVGAISDTGELASFSSRGPVTADGSDRLKPDIVAPGVQVLSAFPHQTYEHADGTSMAGPHVTGVVALIWSANPALRGQIDLTEQILIETAQPYQGSLTDCGSPLNAAGHGIVDAYVAVKRALEMGSR